MKRHTLTLKEFCMRYPIKETVLKDVGDKTLIEESIWSRSLVYNEFPENAKISFNELTVKDEEDYYNKIKNDKAKNDIFEMYDVEIEGKKTYGKNNCLVSLNRKQVLELADAMRNFRDGIIIM